MSQTLLYIINHMDWFWSHRLPLAQGAQEKGWAVSVACSGASKDKGLPALGFTGQELASGPVLKTIWATRKILQQTRPEIAHAITLKYAFITGLAGLGLKDIKFIHTIAGLGYLFSGQGLKPKLLRMLIAPVLRYALKNALLIFQNPDDLEVFLQRGLATKAQCHLIRGSGVDVQHFTLTPEPKTDSPLVLMPTRLVHEKGVAVFVEAARILKARGALARFQIAGGLSSTNPNAITRTQIEKMTRDDTVQWLGKVTDMPALLATAALIVYPSYYREGIPKVLLEAAASGRATITTDHPGCREAVTHGKNGLLVPVKDAQATADAIETLLKDDVRRAKMGTVSRARAEKEFDVRLIVEQTLRLYED